MSLPFSDAQPTDAFTSPPQLKPSKSLIALGETQTQLQEEPGICMSVRAHQMAISAKLF